MELENLIIYGRAGLWLITLVGFSMFGAGLLHWLTVGRYVRTRHPEGQDVHDQFRRTTLWGLAYLALTAPSLLLLHNLDLP